MNISNQIYRVDASVIFIICSIVEPAIGESGTKDPIDQVLTSEEYKLQLTPSAKPQLPKDPVPSPTPAKPRAKLPSPEERIEKEECINRRWATCNSNHEIGMRFCNRLASGRGDDSASTYQKCYGPISDGFDRCNEVIESKCSGH
jgi:hypothetical protein